MLVALNTTTFVMM